MVPVRTRRIALLVVGLLSLAACNSAAKAPTTPPPGGLTADQTAPLTSDITLNLGSTYNLAVGDLVVADQLGYFADEHIKLNVQVVANSQDAIALLAQGRLDAVGGAISAGLLNSIASGLQVRIVSGLATNAAVPGSDSPSPSGVFIRKELYDAGTVTKAADLKGHNVASVGGLGAGTSYLWALYLKQGGLTLSDVTLKNLGTADSLAALKSGAVDAAYLTAPFAQQAVAQGIGVELGNAREVYGNETQSAILFGPSLLANNPQAGAAFLRALKRGADAMQGDYRTKPDIVAALKTGAKLTDADVQNTPPYFMSVKYNNDTVLNMQTIFLAEKDVLSYKDPLPVTQLVDDRFLKAVGV